MFVSGSREQVVILISLDKRLIILVVRIIISLGTNDGFLSGFPTPFQQDQ